MSYNLQKAADKLHISEKSLENHIESFYRDFTGEFDKIENVLSTDNYDKIYFEFHKLKSTFKMISANNIVLLCQNVCDTAIENKENKYGIILNDIFKQFKIIISEINE